MCFVQVTFFRSKLDKIVRRCYVACLVAGELDGEEDEAQLTSQAPPQAKKRRRRSSSADSLIITKTAGPAASMATAARPAQGAVMTPPITQHAPGFRMSVAKSPGRS